MVTKRAKPPTSIFALERVVYNTRHGLFVFKFKDSRGKSHEFTSDPDTFRHLVYDFRTCLTVAEIHQGNVPHGPGPLEPGGQIPSIDVAGFDLGTTLDGMMALRVRSANAPEIEMRFHPSALPGLLQGLQDAQKSLDKSH